MSPLETRTAQARQYYAGRDVRRAVSWRDLQAMAHRRLPHFVAEYLEGGSEDEGTLRANRSAFDAIPLPQRVLTGVSQPDTSTLLLGRPTDMPLLVAPTGFNGLLWRDGDVALASAAAAAGIPFVQSTVSNATIEAVATRATRHWMQLYVLRDRSAAEAILARAEAAGCEALVITVDATIYGNREWDRRRYRSGQTLSLASKLDVLRRWRWAANVLGRGVVPGFANLYDFLPPDRRDFTGSAAWIREQMDPQLDWSVVQWARAHWSRSLVIKGIGHVDDARRAIDEGADAIVLSNHGGRQLDGTRSSLSLLSEVRRALGIEVPIWIDGGIRRGADIAKALMLGADGVLAGRMPLYGLAAGGEAGASRALVILHEELTRVMALVGARDIAALKALGTAESTGER